MDEETRKAIAWLAKQNAEQHEELMAVLRQVLGQAVNQVDEERTQTRVMLRYGRNR